MAPVVPGQSFDVKLRFTNRGSVDVDGHADAVTQGRRQPSACIRRPDVEARSDADAHAGQMTVPSTPAFSRPYFSRPVNCREPLHDQRSRVAPSPGVGAGVSSRTCRYNVGGVPVDIRVPVTRREAQLPYGYVMRELAVVPALAVTVSPRQAIVPRSSAEQERPPAGGADEQRAVGKQRAAGAEASGRMEVRAGRRSRSRSRGRARSRGISSPSPCRRSRTASTRIDAVATADGREFQRRLRRHRAPRSRDALPVSRRRRAACAAST